MAFDPANDWWKRATCYQIYPRSFADSDGDGVGDLRGIIQRLDYLNGSPDSLGVDAIWLSPTFPSPMRDFGYDVADYCDVHPVFGSLADMDALVAACHQRGIRVLLDWVPNHTSDQHPWFVVSRSSRDSPKRDWYVWRDPRPDGSPPNNWESVFGGPAWTFDEATGQYYLHSFLREQPDLNWRNPEVVEAMYETLRFWFRRGIDGFRIDVVARMMKHPDLPDNPPARPEDIFARAHNYHYPDVFDTVRGVRRVFDEFPGTFAVGEVFGAPEDIAEYYGGDTLNGLHLVFNFAMIHERGRDYTPWDAEALARILRSAEASLPAGAQFCWAFNNHDRSRFVSRHNHDRLGAQRARAAALLLLGLRGTPFLYYGEELGMPNVPIPEERLQDPARFHTEGRDPVRTPMQWNDSPGRGFTRGEPWLPFGPAELHVAAQTTDPVSLLSLYRRAIRLRKETPALHSGSYREVGVENGVLAFRRDFEGASVSVLVNTATRPRTFSLGEDGWGVLLDTHDGETRVAGGQIALPALGAAWLKSE